MLAHDFYQIALKDIVSMSEDKILDYIIEHKKILPCMSLPDSMVRRNLGRIDNQEFKAFDLSTYTQGKMKVFSSFLNTRAEIQTIGINYYGITILDNMVLKALVDHHEHICPVDLIKLNHFLRYCKNALAHEKWIIHWGI